jgi:hypothetical protein
MAAQEWTEDQDKTLAALWRAGRTATEIANTLTKSGIRSTTRDAVLGRIHRLKIHHKSRESRV